MRGMSHMDGKGRAFCNILTERWISGTEGNGRRRLFRNYCCESRREYVH